MEKNKPINKIRFGAAVASIWENGSGKENPFRTVTLEMLYKKGDDWKSSTCFSSRNLPNAIKALDAAHTFLVTDNDEN